MKLIIQDKEYDLYAAMQKPSLLMLMELQAKAGVGMKSLISGAKKFKGMEPLDVLDDPEALKIFAALIWLARKHAGEKISYEDSAAVPLDQFRWSTDDDDDEGDDAADPQEAPEGSDRGDKQPAPRKRPTTSRTSSSPSSRTSSASPDTGPE